MPTTKSFHTVYVERLLELTKTQRGNFLINHLNFFLDSAGNKS